MALVWISRKLDFGNDYFEFNLRFLYLVGLWPKENISRSHALLYKMYEIFLDFASFIYLSLTGIGTYQHKDDVIIFLSSLDKSIVAYHFVSKVIIYFWKRDQIKKLIAKIEISGDIITEERKKMMSTLVIFIAGVSTSIVATFGLIAQIKYELIVEAWMPFDPFKNRMNLILASQILALTMLVPCLYRSIAIQGLVCSLMMYVCDQLVELQENLRNLKYSPETEINMRNQFKEIVKKHVRIIKYSKEMDMIFQEFFIVQNLAVTVEMCLNAMMVTLVGLSEKDLLVNFLAFLGIALLNAYIYCYLGNELIIQSEGIAVSAYETAWTSWPVDLQKDLLLMIRQAQRPISLSAGGMAAMSFETYCQALYNGYSIFAVLYDAVN